MFKLVDSLRGISYLAAVTFYNYLVLLIKLTFQMKRRTIGLSTLAELTSQGKKRTKIARIYYFRLLLLFMWSFLLWILLN